MCVVWVPMRIRSCADTAIVFICISTHFNANATVVYPVKIENRECGNALAAAVQETVQQVIRVILRELHNQELLDWSILTVRNKRKITRHAVTVTTLHVL